MAETAPETTYVGAKPMAKKKWIAGAIGKKGALRATAKRLGLISGGEALSKQDTERLARSKNPITAKRARLAETLRGFHK